eukprot:TRINITY_DN48_c0_g1_i1.p1 TRINITY_DN48_c0_g1~~TRINITY_DN48_c0_g1_i1.p1  ORF type:complete len:351 (-),score=114.15 TRINITY_DN48_c0_g1_i1:114-1166(-)
MLCTITVCFGVLLVLLVIGILALRTKARTGKYFSFKEKYVPLENFDLSNRVVVITGCNTGIGKETVVGIAKMKCSNIIMCCRSKEKANNAINDIKKRLTKEQIKNVNFIFVALELGNMKSIENAANTIKEFDCVKESGIYALINNAGLANENDFESDDGYQIVFAVNHLGPFCFTKHLITELVKYSKQNDHTARIVNLGSAGADLAKLDPEDFQSKECQGTMGKSFTAYANSKLCNALFTFYLDSLLKENNYNISCYVVHPGWVKTDIARNGSAFVRVLINNLGTICAKSSWLGTQTSLYCAVEAGDDESGLYFQHASVHKLKNKDAYDVSLQKKLWEKSLEYAGFDSFF